MPGSRSALAPDRAIKPGRHGLSREAVGLIQRGRLIDGFVRQVAEHGYTNVTISRVTEAAGVTKKAFYLFFPSMEDCFVAALEQGAAVLEEAVRTAFQTAPDWRSGIEAGLDALLRTLAAEEPFARLVTVEVAGAGARVRAVRDEYLERFRAVFDEPGYGGETRDHVVDAVVGGVYSTLYLQVDSGRTADLLSLLPSLLYFVMLPLPDPEKGSSTK
ncbi:TetR/AcrR family transcriptional regulator [Actinocorallia longicatena]|uniref:TetR/AcrR family transcriptional regulator n=1 Tax=Actinocorallia longicatena TaxID=111803 RepID=UPI0031D44ED9